MVFINPKLIDLAFILYIGFAVGWGYFIGGVSEFFNIAGLVVILAISMRTYDKLAEVLTNTFGFSNISAFILAFVVICAFIYVILKILKYAIEKKIAQSETMTQANKTAGMFAGFIKGVLVSLVIAIGVIVMPLGEAAKERLGGSNFISFAKVFKPYVINLFGDKELFEAASKMSMDPKAPDAKMVSAMAESKEFLKIVNHPKLQEFAQDEEIKKLVEKQDVMGLMSNKKFLELLNDKEMMDIIRSVDIKKLLKDMDSAQKPGAAPNGQNAPPETIPGLKEILNK